MKDPFAGYDSWKTDYSSTVAEETDEVGEFEGTCAGIPCIIKYMRDSLDCFELFDRRDRPAAWLQKKLDNAPPDQYRKWIYDIESQIKRDNRRSGESASEY